MKATVEILKAIFLEGYTMEKGIVLFPLSIIEIIFHFLYFILNKINIQFMTPYIIDTIIIVIVVLNTYFIVTGQQIITTKKIWKFKASSIFILLILTYPICAEFPEIQSEAALLKIILSIAWLTEIIKEYMFFDVDKFLNRTMITLFIMACLIVQLGVNYMLVLIPSFLITGNLIRILKMKWRKR